MKIFSLLFLAASSSAFTILPNNNHCKISTTAHEMGMFDFFSSEAREARELAKRKEYEEQERLQQEIMERRRNPEKMREYESKVRVRRNLRMAGRDSAAEKVNMYTDAEKKALLDGTPPEEQA
uniref:Uncharacterized protein n=1 Tax=Ditylum brightwellii TaxID=49249 RepID=A0A6V2PYF5_9STRA|mmetsp:Transcript_24333/g.36284  ORF Transcript_24333/g.36284 Transcript_24333/m.36284 type:complete len:123 (+) Transcript_24333:76-444(+)